MSPEYVECGEEQVFCRDGEFKEDVWSRSINQECDEIDNTKDRKEAPENGQEGVEQPEEGMTFNSPEEAYTYYVGYAREKGFAVVKRTSGKGKDGRLKDAGFECSRAGKARVNTKNPVKPRPQTKIGCPAHVTVVIHPDGKWRLNRVVLEHNHEQSPEKARYFKSNRVLDEQVKRKLDLNDQAGIRLHKTYDSLQIEAGGPHKLPYLERDYRNYLDKLRRLRLREGDAKAMHNYFMRMKADNSELFFAMDLNEKGRLRNVFWSDARSRAACKEFGDVVTFDTTYLVNKYDMPFAPFVGVNHHGHSILLGCGLISHEDTESFSWLFDTWKTCMWGCAPKAIITDQCMAMKNAVENVFPNTRHQWCIWHIMKKLPEKLSGYDAYDKISWSMRKAVYNSLTIDEFEDAWNGFIKKYELQSNTWLELLYQERKRWVPAYVKDCFWAGMSSTQRSEGMNAYFDGYIHSNTTLKQFVEQYENALANKVEIEKQEDVKSWNTCIPLITKSELEKQFQSVYTDAKVEEFHAEFVRRLECSCEKVGDSEYEVKEWVTFGEGEEIQRKQVPFSVYFNAKTNETRCNCRLFEFKGMVYKHQLMVWNQRGIERVPEKYILRRWCKNVNRVHTKIQISYDKSSTSIEARRHDNMCNLFEEVANLLEDSQEKYEMVMTRVSELKRELIEASVVSASNVVSLGDGVPLSTQSTILDPEGLRRKGRPPCKRKQGVVEKTVKKKKENIKKSKSREKVKEVKENGNGQGFGTQERIVNVHPRYMGQSMWPNMQANIAHGGSIIPFSQTFCPTETTMSQFIPSFPRSQSNTTSLFNGQLWRSQPTTADNQVWIEGQSSFLEDQSQYGRGPQPCLLQSQNQGRGGQQSYLELMNAMDNIKSCFMCPVCIMSVLFIHIDMLSTLWICYDLDNVSTESLMEQSSSIVHCIVSSFLLGWMPLHFAPFITQLNDLKRHMNMKYF